MPVLENARHEKFAQGVASGKTLVDAHEAAGYKRNDSNAATLHNGNKRIRDRVAELKTASANKVVMNGAWVLAKLRENAERALLAEDGAVANRALELIGKHFGVFEASAGDNEVECNEYEVSVKKAAASRG